LSSSAPMVVGGSPPVRVGRRQAICEKSSSMELLFFYVYISSKNKWFWLMTKRPHCEGREEQEGRERE
ncbi:hypothetical protein LCL98_25205, partial [Rossellomorea aquimaris]|nr:hypothetical protein [Rossellomorea aquimaris]